AKLRCKQCSHLFSVLAAVEEERVNPAPSLAPGALPRLPLGSSVIAGPPRAGGSPGARPDAEEQRSSHPQPVLVASGGTAALPALGSPPPPRRSTPPKLSVDKLGNAPVPAQLSTGPSFVPRMPTALASAAPPLKPAVGIGPRPAGIRAAPPGPLGVAAPLAQGRLMAAETVAPLVPTDVPDDAETRPLPVRERDNPEVGSEEAQPVAAAASPSEAVTALDVLPSLPAPSFPPVASFAPPRQPKTVPALLAYFSTTVALLFGVGLGYLLFGHQEAEVRYVAAQAEVENSRVSHAPPPPPVTAEASDAVSAGATASASAALPPPARSGAVVLPEAVKSPNGVIEGSTSSGSLLAGLGAGGPGGPSASPGAPDSAGSSLDASAIERTIQRHQATVKRACWQPALNGRALGAPSTARVSVTIQIAPSGSVKSATTSAEPAGYPGLAGCIQGKVATWTFPRATGPTTTRVPFVFAAQ
ncbi:MAG: hypothetical protein RJA70_4513, partial [Pseudomonadota bacterium]